MCICVYTYIIEYLYHMILNVSLPPLIFSKYVHKLCKPSILQVSNANLFFTHEIEKLYDLDIDLGFIIKFWILIGYDGEVFKMIVNGIFSYQWSCAYMKCRIYFPEHAIFGMELSCNVQHDIYSLNLLV